MDKDELIFSVTEMVINGQRYAVRLDIPIKVPMQNDLLVPPNNYRRLVEYMVAKYGRGGLPARSYPATADLLSREVGWPVDASCLNTAHWRWLRKQKSSKIIGAPISTAKRN